MKFYPDKFCVYAHFIGKKCIYVGKGSWTRAYDFKIRRSRWNTMVLKYGIVPTIKFLRWFSSEQAALDFEKEVIKRWRPICNIAFNIHYVNKGRPLSVEHRRKLSAVRLGVPWSKKKRANYERRKADAERIHRG